MYIDGVECDSQAVGGSLSLATIGDTYVSRSIESVVSPWNGNIDELSYWNLP